MNVFIKKIFAHTILFFIVICEGNAQYDFFQLTNNEGLSNSAVNCIYQDSEQIMWFGTWSGLNSYNGNSFRNYMPEPFNESSISNSIIREITEDQQHNLWISTDYGINRYNRETGLFQRYYFGYKENAPAREKCFRIVSDNHKNIFCFIYEWGLGYYNKSKQEFESLNIPKVNTFKISDIIFDSRNDMLILDADGKIYKVTLHQTENGSFIVENSKLIELDLKYSAFFKDKNNNFWCIGDQNIIHRINFDNQIITSENRFDSIILSEDKIVSLHSTNEHLIIGLNRSGVFIHEKSRNNELLNLKNHLGFQNIFSLFFDDKNDILWIGTDGQGVFAVYPGNNNFYTFSNKNIPELANNVIRSFCIDQINDLWIGTKGGGLVKLPGFNFISSSYGENVMKLNLENGLNNNAVFSITKDSYKENIIWIGTDGEGIHYFDNKSKKLFHLPQTKNKSDSIRFGSVYAICQTDENTLWLGTSGSGLINIETKADKQGESLRISKLQQFLAERGNKNSLSHNVIYSIIQDDNEYIWIGTRGGGLNRLNTVTGKLNVFKTSPDNKKSISNNDILCLTKDRSDNLWVGTSFGLNRLTTLKEDSIAEFRFYSDKDGLPDNSIHGIIEDENGMIWVSTNNGLSRFNPETNSFNNFTINDGLQSNEFSDGAFYKSLHNNALFFGGINGFNVFIPENIHLSQKNPEAHISSFKINNRERNIYQLTSEKSTNQIVLKNNENFFSFDFVALDYIKNENCEYTYILEGFNNEWVYNGTSNTAIFTNVPPGDYIFKVRCTNHDKIWSKNILSFPLKINRPFWTTTPAIGMYLSLFIALVSVVILIIKKRKEFRDNLRTEKLMRLKEEEIHNAKLQFFTNLSHEICTPLSLIYGPVQKLMDYSNSDQYIKKYATVIHSNTNRVLSLIQQLFDFRKVETDYLELSFENIDVNELFKYIEDCFIEKIEENNFDFKIETSGNLKVWFTDREKLEKIIFNLFSNAIKYTPRNGTITIKYWIEKTNLLISFYNSGYGISASNLKKIFDRFSVLKLDNENLSNTTSFRSGIGLALTKRLVELLNGTIEVVSEVNKFTQFNISLSHANPEEMENHIINKIVTDNARPFQKLNNNLDYSEEHLTKVLRKNKLILVVDDEEDIRNLVKDIIVDHYDVLEAATADDAEKLLMEKHPDLIICDILMPGTDGLSFSKKLKENFITSHIPVILLTALQSVSKKIEALSIGADDFITKPFHPTHLLVRIENLLSKKKKLKEFFDLSIDNHVIPKDFLIGEKDKALIKRITEIIENNIDNPELNPTFICDEISMSRMHFYRKLKGLVQKSPSEFIRVIKLKHAARYLINTDLSVLEIIYQSGFNNKSYFYREFNNLFECSPLEYRERFKREF